MNERQDGRLFRTFDTKGNIVVIAIVLTRQQVKEGDGSDLVVWIVILSHRLPVGDTWIDNYVLTVATERVTTFMTGPEIRIDGVCLPTLFLFTLGRGAALFSGGGRTSKRLVHW